MSFNCRQLRIIAYTFTRFKLYWKRGSPESQTTNRICRQFKEPARHRRPGGSRREDLFSPERRGRPGSRLTRTAAPGGRWIRRAGGPRSLPPCRRRNDRALLPRRRLHKGPARYHLPAVRLERPWPRHPAPKAGLDRHPAQGPHTPPSRATGQGGSLLRSIAALRGRERCLRGCPRPHHEPGPHRRGLLPLPASGRQGRGAGGA